MNYHFASVSAMLALAVLLAGCGDDPAAPPREFTDEMVSPVYVENAAAAFNALPGYGLYLEARTDNDFDYGWGVGVGHIQGIQRLRGGDYLALSSKDGEGARIALVGILSTPGGELLASNEGPPTGDKVYKVYKDFGGGWIHAGGMATCGDILVVPLENDTSSEIRFLFAPPDDPLGLYDLSARFEHAIVRRPEGGSGAQAGAVALTRFPVGPHRGHYLLAVLTHGDHGPLDFYLSNTARIFDGFRHVAQWDGVQDPAPFHGNQNMDFIMQTDGLVYIVGTDNESAPGGEDWAELYWVQYEGESFENLDLALVARKHFYCYDHGDFEGGAGLYANHDGSLAMYAVEQFTTDLEIRMIEFGWTPDSPYYVMMFDDVGHADRSLRLSGVEGHYLPDYHHVYAAPEWGFNDKVSSVRWYLPRGVAYTLYEDSGYGGSTLDLVGTGQAEQINDLGAFGDKTSSSRFTATAN